MFGYFTMVRQKSQPLGFIQRVNFESIDSLKPNSTKYLVDIDNPCENNCKRIYFAVLATNGTHGSLSTSYIGDKFFHQNKLGWDVETQNTRFFLQTSP